MRRRPIGVWIAAAYLLVLLALGVIFLAAAIEGGSLYYILVVHIAALLAVLSGAILLMFLSRWSALAIALVAVMQVGPYVAYLLVEPPSLPEPQESADVVVYVFSIQYSFAPLVLLTATSAVLLYAVWLWRTGVLR